MLRGNRWFVNGECYFCHGPVSGFENDHILLDEHADHEVYLHRRCAVGHDIVEGSLSAAEPVEVTCPECGAVEIY